MADNNIEIKSKKISELTEISQIQANAYILTSIPGVTNYKMSLSNLKNAINNDAKNNEQLISYISGILVNYSTDAELSGVKEELQQYINLLSGSVYTKQQIDAKISGIVIPEVNLSEYATKSELQTAISGIVIPETDLTNYYTKSQVDTAIANASLSGQVVDLTNYTTKDELTAAISGYATISQLNEAISGIAPVEPNLSGYVTISQLNEALSGVSINQSGSVQDLSNYATKDDLKELSGLIKTNNTDLTSLETKIDEVSGQLSALGDILEEINSTTDQDTNINTIAEISQFLTGFSEGTTLSGILNQLKQSILDEIASGYVQSMIVK